MLKEQQNVQVDRVTKELAKGLDPYPPSRYAKMIEDAQKDFEADKAHIEAKAKAEQEAAKTKVLSARRLEA